MMQRTIGWKLEELDRILNDPSAPPMEAHRVWSLLDDVSGSFGSGDSDRSVGSDHISGGP